MPYGGYAQFDIVTFVLETILKIDYSTIGKYATVEDQLLYLVLIPHVVGLLFLFGLATTITAGHKGLRNLIGITGYIFLVLSGWYGTMVPWIILYWQVLLITYFLVFFVSIFWHPSEGRETFKLGEKLTEEFLRGPRLRKQLDLVNKKIAAMERDIPTREEGEGRAYTEWKKKHMDLIYERKQLEDAIERGILLRKRVEV